MSLNNFSVIFSDETKLTYNIESSTIDFSYSFNFGGLIINDSNTEEDVNNHSFMGNKVSRITWYIRGAENDETLNDFILLIYKNVNEGKEIQKILMEHDEQIFEYNKEQIYNIFYSNNINGPQKDNPIARYELKIELK